MKNKKVLLIGSLPPPFTGQSISFDYLNMLPRKLNFRIYNTNKASFDFLNYLDSLIILPFHIIFYQIDIIYFLGSRSKFGFLRQLPFLTIAAIKKIKLINHLHGADFKEFYKKGGFLKPIIVWAYKKVDISIVLLEEMKDQFQAFPKMKLEVIPNAVSKEFENLDIIFPKEKRILFLSNIMASKGIIEFLKASKKLLNDYKTIRIDIAGEFVSDTYMTKNQIKKNFLYLYKILKKDFSERIFYHGPVNGKNKINLLKLSSIFILPTYYPTEAFPISIIEAMTTGNVIVTTKHNYLEKIISEKHGETIQIKDSRHIVSSIKKLFGDQQKMQEIQKTNMMQSKKYKLENHLNLISKILLND